MGHTDELDLGKCTRMLTVCTSLQLRVASRIVTRIFDEALRPIGVRSTQLPILTTLAVIGSAPIKLLAEKLFMDRTTLAQNCKPLETGGHLQITVGKDRRERNVTLTTQGKEVLSKAVPLWERAQDQVIQELGASQWQYLLGGLSAVIRLAPEEKS